ncbi:alpha-1,2-fucosyltransferase [Agrobacterium tumefaciens]|nr:alpha-1,2-fucosyltransferase [Agrobacterium tumefaciens]NTE18913.1 alpha-1,2-fucosyltransferase [Agrobacterium tumefaciens]
MMIIIKIKGGLGNQMFQYAVASAMNKSTTVYFDQTFLNNQKISSDVFTARKYELAIFKRLNAKNANPFIIKALYTQKKYYALLRTFLTKINLFKSIDDNNIKTELEKSHYFMLVYLEGYFQNPSYFENIRENLLHDFTFPQLSNLGRAYLKNIKRISHAASIHVRRGDFLKKKIASIHGILDLSYYHDAKDYLAGQVDNPHFFIFSDDANWCKENFSFIENSTIVSNLEPWEDMYLMTVCQHHIIANSTFSWWGAWLSTNKKQINIAPKNWFKDPQLNLVYQNIIPKNWIKL